MQKIYLGQHRVVSLWNKTMFLQCHFCLFKQSKLNVAQNSYKKYKKLMNSSLLNSPNQSKSQILFHKKSPHHRNLFDRLCLPPKCLYGKIPDGPNVEIRRKGEEKPERLKLPYCGAETQVVQNLKNFYQFYLNCFLICSCIRSRDINTAPTE